MKFDGFSEGSCFKEWLHGLQKVYIRLKIVKTAKIDWAGTIIKEMDC